MKKSIVKSSLLALAGLFFSATLWAHGGAAGTDTDQCKFELEPDHWIHYTAYQPLAYPAEDFCGNLPDIGTMTQLVFDYQDIRFRNMAVEFEVTKEPEGTQIFFMPAKKHKSGSVILKLPNGVPEVGKYLIHITLVKDNGERLDAHMSFVAGKGAVTSSKTMFMYLLFALAGLYVLYLSHAGFKKKVDEIIENIKKA
ncbi:hypothetical protein [methanotrophic endosymbiont of Bathymodiolus puteoserpentis (Logatchev)]|jgi:hypothetical protein|uniref:hypothetical protein n=1 Tax=methanotrophic endosymbiont of Bathymodiolus puteoserpentis (Logatchev) TaxID=343235 RepID=UPI0013CC0D94|nr:hypothetical protein [methanotrophic endosymbiont of Bathymodiolus puteoserpentis (Logatchev)]SHE23013.1 possible (AF047705) unknown [Nitrosococcus oceani] [methanotrophic endosymbiont of Bathymodiolus puteoserpentis (Logatchev)]